MAKTPIEEMTKLAGDLIGVVVAQEVKALQVVQAELEVLAKGAPKPATPQEAAQIEAAIEAAFDNMPI